MRILCIHAHFDDFEFVAAGTFELFRRRLESGLQAKIVICTDGRSGHQFRTREETARIRLAEQATAARVGGYQFERLARPDGRSFGEARLLTNDLLAALWKAIRDFEPDYLFCPPLPEDTRAGVHPDHITVAEAVRRVAYMINVPHAFLDEYPVADESVSRWIKTPVILNTFDSYMGASGSRGPDFWVDVELGFNQIVQQSWCHQSQITEWLPWIGRHDMSPPADLPTWEKTLRERALRQRRSLGLGEGPPVEVFALTQWGESASREQIEKDFPTVHWF